LQLVKLMSEVKVVRRWARVQRAASVSTVLPVQVRLSRANIGLVVIGASTGGPLALQTLVAGLPTRFPAPVVIVQHMATGFVEGFVQWLASACNRQVCIAEHGERLRPGIVYVGLDGYEMTVSVHESIALAPCQGRNALCPSISALFRSAAEIFGPRAVGVLLSGMGKDGALELKVMKERGAITFAQDLESSIVHGMPGEAIRLGGASYILPPAEIAAALAALVE